MNKLNILITGDFCPRNRIADLIKGDDYLHIFNDFLPVIKNSDIAITNLECPITHEKEKIEKTGPNFNTPEKTIQALTYAGFNLVSLANNHIMDYGEAGLKSTIETCNKSGIEHVGVGSNLKEAREPFYTEINGIRVAIINFCENEWSTTTGKAPGANPLNPVCNYYDIKEAKEKAGHVIVIVHGGHEHYPLPSPRMQETYRFFVDVGASVVVGHHTHCFSGYEIYQGAPIFYSLGNFIFDWQGVYNSDWNKGYAILLNVDNDSIAFTLYPFIQGDQKPGVRLMNKPEKKIFEEQLELLNVQISDSKKLESKFQEFIHSRKKSYLSYFVPCSNRLLSGLFNRGLLPSLISEKKKRLFLNVIRCEAHREVLINILND